jgi:hypothetical protein
MLFLPPTRASLTQGQCHSCCSEAGMCGLPRCTSGYRLHTTNNNGMRGHRVAGEGEFELCATRKGSGDHTFVRGVLDLAPAATTRTRPCSFSFVKVRVPSESHYLSVAHGRSRCAGPPPWLLQHEQCASAGCTAADMWRASTPKSRRSFPIEAVSPVRTCRREA